MRWAFFLDIISKKSSISPVPTTSLILPCFLFPVINIKDIEVIEKMEKLTCKN